MVLIAVFVLLVFGYSLVSQRLQRTVITAPMLFTFAGAATILLPEAARELVVDRELLLLFAELGLVMLLFTDASRISPSVLTAGRSLPLRLLGVGTPLTIVLGAACAIVVLSGLSWWEAAILGAILAPTDAGLGQVIVDSERVPLRIRQGLNVEAGLNDGLSVPFLMLFIVLAVAKDNTVSAGGVFVRLLGEQLGYGTLIGIGIGGLGGWLLGVAHRRQWMAPSLGQLGVVALPVLCVIVAEATAASMFIAAFVAGFAAQFAYKDAGRRSVEFAEDWGQLFNYFVFFFFFGTSVADIWGSFTPDVLLYAVLSLTVVRMVPVALALLGTRLSRATVLFMGWFGPRGLASIVLGLVYLEREANLPGTPTIRLAVIATVLLSIFAHGMSAQPGINLYARRIAGLDETSPEHLVPGDGSPEPPHGPRVGT
ncbi:cation:proton antiporter [Mycobacterium sp. Y57]|uniref:cation:proton antiporter domain-containing protein n=1 Tax=Mycolicibacterium xanthum TaxID=2796469 RepID=UPI001C84DFA2|nr:cation:proton antiporter [Mycolicibacterium xanthum]MBX7433257.1 cation:proton antiporter [Mycolicibacterium xanthum]